MLHHVVVLVDALAAYRLTRLVTEDTLTLPLRARVIEEAYKRTGVTLTGTDAEVVEQVFADEDEAPKIAVLVTCRWCAGVWVAFGVVALRRLVPRAWEPVGTALALSAAAALLARLEDDD